LMENVFDNLEESLSAAGISHQIVRHRMHQYVAKSRNQIFELAVEHNSDFACLMVSLH